MKSRGKYSTVDEYIDLHPAPIKAGLVLLRKTIKTAAPGAEELISYQMPAYKLNGMLAFFSATKTHYGFYPTSGPVNAYKEKLKSYDTSKGTIRFPLNKPLPIKLISEIVKWKVRDNLSKVKAKSLMQKK
jgi:uncharacterized protein YdhG (YjbR/CyaY superfamily)